MPIKIDEISKILVIQFEPFGDILLNTAYLPALRKKFPKAHIVFLARTPFHKVLENNPHIDEVMVFKQGKGMGYVLSRIKVFARVFARRFDIVIDQMRGTGSAQIAMFSMARYRLGWANSRVAFMYNIPVLPGENRYSASMKFDLLKPLGIDEEPYKLHYHIKDESFQYIDQWIEENHLTDFVCISPGSPVPKKKWRLENYAQVADMIIEKLGLPVVILWGPREMDDVNGVISHMKRDALIAPPTDFNQGAAMLTRAKLLVCNDGGINHLCASTGTPALSIFGNTNPINWCPKPLGNYRCLYVPDHPKDDGNRFGISPETVMKNIEQMLQRQ